MKALYDEIQREERASAKALLPPPPPHGSKEGIYRTQREHAERYAAAPVPPPPPASPLSPTLAASVDGYRAGLCEGYRGGHRDALRRVRSAANWMLDADSLAVLDRVIADVEAR